MHRGKSLLHNERWDEGIAIFDKLIALEGKNAAAWYFKGIADPHMALHNEAQESFEQAIALDGECAAAWYQKGLVLFERELFDESLPAFGRALDLAPAKQDYAFRKALASFMLDGTWMQPGSLIPH